MSSKRVIVFDLDGTLALSKTMVDACMMVSIWELMHKYKVGVISGASFNQFMTQFIGSITFPSHAENLYLMPTCGSAMYMYDNGWKSIYEDLLTDVEKEEIMTAFRHTIPMLSYGLGTSFGPRIEDRKCQITFSALGQNAPLEEKSIWDPTTVKRQELKALLDKHFGGKYEVRIGGATSVDVTHKGIDKAYGITKLQEFLNVGNDDILFVGDALYAGGNDYPVKAMGIDCLSVNSPSETMEIIRALLGDN